MKLPLKFLFPLLLCACALTARAADAVFETRVPMLHAASASDKAIAASSQQRLSIRGSVATWHRYGREIVLKVTEHGEFLLLEEVLADKSMMYYPAFRKDGKLFFNGTVYYEKEPPKP